MIRKNSVRLGALLAGTIPSLRRESLWMAFLVALLVPIFIYSRSAGPPSGLTGGFGEGNCTQCHRTNEVNTGAGSLTISAPASYTSGSAYPIRVTVSHPDQQRWGFELSARTQGGQQAGALVPGAEGFTQLLAELNGIQYISHTSAGTRLGTHVSGSFDFIWVAPDTSAGPVVFNTAGNAANGSLSNSGDFVYTTELTLPPRTASVPAPTLPVGSVVNNASYAPSPAPVAAGSIVALFGTNLTDGASATFSAFGNDRRLLTNLAGARVTINGTPAPLLYATPGQLGIQVPTELTGSTADVQISVAGRTGATRTINIDAFSPGIFSFSGDGRGPGAITHADGTAVSATNAAQQGEVVSIYATGLGQVTPAVPTGALPSGTVTTVTRPTVTIDGIAAEVQFSGLSGCCVGVNQINVVVPTTVRIANDVSVVLSIGGKQSNTVTIATRAR